MTATKVRITTCPTCGSRRIRRVRRDITSNRGGKPYIARGIVIEECPNCGERLFSPDALEKIAAQRPRASKRVRTRPSV